ncbi:MAG: helix-turn-helix domain-containing protein, partial [Marinicella sp.]
MKYIIYLYVIGAAQGFILAIALLLKKVNQHSNKVLAVWLLLLGFDLLMKVVYLNNQNTDLLPAYVLVQFFPFLYGSFFYIYVRTITVKRPFIWRDVIHFMGFFIMVGLNLHWIFNPWENTPRAFAYFDLTLYLYSVSYVLAGLMRIKRYRLQLEQEQSNTDGISLVWIDVMAYFQALIWFIAVTQWLVPIKAYNVWIIYLAVAVWMTVMGYLALLQQNIQPLQQVVPPQKIDNERFPEVNAKLSQLMDQDHLFLDPTLNIGRLAKKSGYPEYLVSLVINQIHGKPFREYINQLRIQAAKEMLEDTNNGSTILNIAYDCGFTSKSTFNTAFKRIMQQ